MESTSSKREAIQKQLQLLKDEREREQQAFDELSRRHDLTADEIASLAKKRAAEEEPQSLEVDGALIAVGQKIDVVDDVSVLLRAEKGYMVNDPVKRVYLGERGEVLRIMPSFQGKPAVELRFADGAVKVFFAECIKAAEQSDSGKKKADDLVAAAPPLKIEKKAPVATAEKQPTPPVPGWTELAMPRRGRKSSATQEAAPKELAAASAEEPKRADPPKEARVHRPAKAAPALIPEPHNDGEGLGLPMESSDSNAGDRLALVGGELDNLAKTPRASFLAAEAAALAASRPPQVVSDLESQVPQHCLPDYVAKFSFDDASTKIPRFRPSKVAAVRKCLVAGYAAGVLTPLSFQSIAFRGSVDSMDSVLAAVTRELGWDVKGERARRLFAEDGTEIMWADAIATDMHLVATAGCLYVPAAAGASSATLSNSAPARHTRGEHAAPKRTATPSGAPSTRKTTSAVGAGAKPIHIRLFENGEYGDDHFERAYITVTIRPTYKTMASVKSMFTRELKWRDGKKVDMLFDATGAEIESVEQLVDGACIVASAGDRFVIPFPNTQLHAEAMKLNQ